MPYVSRLCFPVMVAAALSACVEEQAPVDADPLTAQVKGRLYFSPGADWVGAEDVQIKLGDDTLCEESRDLGAVATSCSDCDIALDLDANEDPLGSCALAPETAPEVWIPGRYVLFEGSARFDGVRIGVLRVSDDQENWTDWSSATLDGNLLSFSHDLVLTIEQPEDFEPKQQQPQE